IPTGFDLADIPPAGPESERTEPGAVTLGYLGTLNTMRRLDVLVEMLALLRAAGMNARLLFVGDAPKPEHRRATERRLAAHGIPDSVEITGNLSQSGALRQLS